MTIIPPSVRLAAKRAFIRTTYQAYAATIPAGGISVAAILSFANNPDLLVAGITVGAAVLSPPLAGLAAYFAWTAKGIPEDYEDAAVQTMTRRTMRAVREANGLSDGITKR